MAVISEQLTGRAFLVALASALRSVREASSLQCTVYMSSVCSMCNVQCAVCTVQHVQCAVAQCALCSMCNAQCAVCAVCKVCSVQCAACSVYNVQCAVCAVCLVQSAVYDVPVSRRARGGARVQAALFSLYAGDQELICGR